MRLGSLRKIDEKNIKDEIQKLNEELKYLNKLIKDKKTLDKFIVSELDLIKSDLDTDIKERKSLISSEQNNDIDISIDEFKEIEKFTVIINKDFQLKRIKEITDEKEIEKIKKENLFSVNLNSNQKILLFVSSGKVYTIDPNILPGGNSNPKSFIYFVDSMPKDKIAGLLSSIDEELLIVSKNGKGFISNTETLVTNQKKGKQLFNLKNNDVVIKVLNLSKKHIACVTKLQKMLIFEIDVLPKLQKGGGVQLIKIKKDDFLSDVTQ
jgi:Type IIA topoisomerase (DNA gyrase/topo II, topoisomerase IV), A subunit